MKVRPQIGASNHMGAGVSKRNTKGKSVRRSMFIIEGRKMAATGGGYYAHKRCP